MKNKSLKNEFIFENNQIPESEIIKDLVNKIGIFKATKKEAKKYIKVLSINNNKMKKVQHTIQAPNEKLFQLHSERALNILKKYKDKLEKFGLSNSLTYSNSGIIYTIYQTKTTFVVIISEK